MAISSLAATILRTFLLLLPLLLFSRSLHAQENSAPTGDLATDLRGGGYREIWRPADSTSVEPRRKSLWIAGGLSAVLPGAGQLYAEAPLWRTLLYGLVEGIGITWYAVNAAKGDRATIDFENYANSHWSVERYAAWIENNLDRWSPEEIDREAARDALRNLYRSTDPGVPAWERIDLMQLNRLERAVTRGFSHTLPERGEQQYYEQIGKYAQYRAGWDDHQPSDDTLVYDPTRTTANSREYMDRRAIANEYLGAAVTAGGVILLNHLASLVDAVITARGYNLTVSARLEQGFVPGEKGGEIRLVPRLELALRF